MILRMAAIFALTLLPPIQASTQELVASPGERTHVVRQGDTLASIARQYLGETAAWERIFEANRHVVSNPHRIHPGMELRIPGVRVGLEDTGVEVIRGTPDDRLVEVRGVVLERERAAEPDTTWPPSVVEDRRELLRTRPFTPAAVPESRAQRTVFHGGLQQSARPLTRPGVVVSDPAEALAVSRSAFNSAAWVSRADDEVGLGRVTGFDGDDGRRIHRTAIQRYDRVLIELNRPGDVQVGEQLVAYRAVGDADGLGTIYAPSGVMEVVAIEDGGAVARVTGGFDRFELGHRVRRPRTFPLSPGVLARATDIEMHATVLAFRDRKEIYLPGDQGFIDRGRAEGVAVGDEFIGIGGAHDGWDGRQIARFQVLWVGEDYATVRLLTSQSPTGVRPGLPVALNRKMP